MTKIYLATRYSRYAEMQGVRDVLEALGHKVTSRWIDLHADTGERFGRSFNAAELNDLPEMCSAMALRDIEDIKACEWLISFTEPANDTTSKGGRHVEFGYALAISVRLTVIGPREHVFHTHPKVEHYPTWPDFVISLGEEAYKAKHGAIRGGNGGN
jgi:hypothetical protein